MCESGNCSMMCCILWGLGWWLVASTLVFLCWNRVLTALTAVKEMKIWHAMIIVATLAVLCWGMCGNCGSGKSCGSCGSGYECGSCGDKDDCCADSLHKH